MSPISLKSNRQSTPAIHFSTKKACLTYIAGRAIRDSPKGMFNWYVMMCCIFAFAGVSKGFDEGKVFFHGVKLLSQHRLTFNPWNETGNIASIVVQSHFRKVFGLSEESDAQYANTKGWLVSIATACAVFGCLGVCQASSENLAEKTS